MLWVLVLMAGLNAGLLSRDVAYGHVFTDDATIPAWQRSRNFSLRAAVTYRLNPLLTLMITAWPQEAGTTAEELTDQQLGLPRRGLPAAKTVPPVAGTIGARRSVVVIAVESLRRDVIGLRHNGVPVMPHVSKLAESGCTFTKAYAQSTHSNYADPCVFSSLYPLRTDAHHYYSASDPWPKDLLYDVLSRHNYRTGMFSSQNESWGNMDQFLHTPVLDVFFDSQSYDGPTYVPPTDTGFAGYVKKAHVAGKLDDAVTVSKAVEWISQPDERPYCLCMNLQSSHFPYPVPDTEPTVFEPSRIDFNVSFLRYPQDKVPVVRNAYFNALHYIDKQIGRLVHTIRSLPQGNRTLIVILGDNGESFYEHGYPTHGGPPVEPQVNVALVMNCPEILESAESNYLTQMIDVVPTVLSLLQVPLNDCRQGIDVLAAERPAPTKRLAFVHCNNGRTKCNGVVSASGWKYTFDLREGVGVLHNTANDPAESVNYATTHPKVAEILSRLLTEWHRRQVTYYGKSQYYGLWNPPKEPELTDAETHVLWENVSDTDGQLPGWPSQSDVRTAPGG
ncbi:MAG: sulfatase-like hydrolase/transferase [Planctomycetaceae bacterium]|nr:sulfatase-like hydrolase/transferase [Planctomycetaceae bacterium]